MAPVAAEDLRGVFIDVDGTRIELDGVQCDDIRSRLRVLKGGLDDVPSDPLITTGQAAELLGVSRRSVTRYMDAGDLPYVRQGRGHRRARMSDVLRFKERYEHEKELLEDMRGAMFEGGLDDLDLIGEYLAQFDDPSGAAGA